MVTISMQGRVTRSWWQPLHWLPSPFSSLSDHTIAREGEEKEQMTKTCYAHRGAVHKQPHLLVVSGDEEGRNGMFSP